MKDLTEAQMRTIDGEGFWGGVLCGGAIMTAFALTVAPEVSTKALVYAGWVTAAGACGYAFS